MLAYPAAERERRGQRHSSDAAFPGQVAAQNLAHRVKPGYGLFVAVEHMERGIDLQPREHAHGIAGDRQGIEDRKSVVEGTSVSVRVDLGGRSINKNTKTTTKK